ncbi:MAG: tRNA guanosine(34) transglycosylase Tgt [Hyphomicrobiales bacterium]|nr:tRNA guanosine(34) transglycosylase Tgt [Hyphomicrobiales bacterium]
MSGFFFKLIAEDKAARRGEIETRHGRVRTPAFMPVGTQATVKALYPQQVREAGADMVLANTYHLMLRPGAERIATLGGLHRFMNWDGPILTDSGGFQVMSLAKLRKVSDQGVTFQSHLDGTTHQLTPERAVEIQTLLGADIQMQLDECIASPASRAEAGRAMRLSLAWAERARASFSGAKGRALFGIVQGNVFEDLRTESARALVDMDFAGYAIGGLAVGEGQELMLKVLDFTVPLLPAQKPRYLMGVGTPEDILESVSRGIDMFDCVIPTRAGRHGHAYTRLGRLNLRNARHVEDAGPLDPESNCPAASSYSRAYLHHLVKAGEYLGAMLLSWANVAYYEGLMAGIREAISQGRFEAFRRETLADLARGGESAQG